MKLRKKINAKEGMNIEKNSILKKSHQELSSSRRILKVVYRTQNWSGFHRWICCEMFFDVIFSEKRSSLSTVMGFRQILPPSEAREDYPLIA